MKSTLVQIALHITKFMWAFFSKTKCSVESENHFCLWPACCQLWSWRWRARAGPSSHWLTLGSKCHSAKLLSLWYLGTCLSQGLWMLTFMVPQPWQWWEGEGSSQHLWSMESQSPSHAVIISLHYNNSLRVSEVIIPGYGWQIWVQRHYIIRPRTHSY